VKLSIRQPARSALLIAAGVMLLSASGAQAAKHRGAVLVKDINPGRSPSITTNGGGNCGCIYNGGDLTDVRGTLYFSANDGKHGFELWRSDGTRRGTRMVKDINPGRGGSDLSGITAVNRIIYFTADDGVHGAALWRSDGTARGTRMVKDINPYELTDVNGTLYFATLSDPNHVSELWRSDGTEAGTTVVKSVSAVALTDFRGALYFSGPGGLWRSDGTEAGTTIVKDNIGIGTYDPLTVVSGILYFAADDGAHGSALWRSDGTEAGTTMVKDFGPGSSLYLQSTSTDGALYFTASLGPGPIPNQLWRSDGTEAGTTLVKQVQFVGFIVAKGRFIYFSGGGGLWRSDGTPQGTTLVRGRPPSGDLGRSLTAAKSTLYLAGSDKRHGQELWRSDGTRAGTTIVRDIRPGSSSSEPTNLTAVGGTLFFTAKDGRHNRELWRAGPPPCAKGKCKKG
jgi:ELWxxDGT repeat protein